MDIGTDALRTGERLRPERRDWLDLRDHAVIGDCHGNALVGIDGGIDWCVFCRHDADPVFCRLLDARRGGHFSIAPEEPFRADRRHLDEHPRDPLRHPPRDGGAHRLRARRPALGSRCARLHRSRRPEPARPSAAPYRRPGPSPPRLPALARFRCPAGAARGLRERCARRGRSGAFRSVRAGGGGRCRAGGLHPRGRRECRPGGGGELDGTPSAARPGPSPSPPPSGASGSPPAATAGRTARQCAAAPSPSSCRPGHRAARSSPPPPPRCRNGPGERATGTIATAGCATRP